MVKLKTWRIHQRLHKAQQLQRKEEGFARFKGRKEQMQ